MCGTCGCGEKGNVSIKKPGETGHESNEQYNIHDHRHTHEEGEGGTHEHTHEHSHEHSHQKSHEHIYDHSHSHPESGIRTREIRIETDILHKNNLLAERNRGYFEARNIFCLNLVSSPGSGKTTLLEKTITSLKQKTGIYVIEGDQQTMNDADRINSAGAPVVQVNTGAGCHLDAEMVNRAFKKLDIEDKSVLIIENVGNLVCPSLFDLGESKRVVIVSVTEGEDKPLKYPDIFQSSDLCIINKTDLLPWLDFRLQELKEHVRKVKHNMEIIELSAKSGEGLEKWYEWIGKYSVL